MTSRLDDDSPMKTKNPRKTDDAPSFAEISKMLAKMLSKDEAGTS